MVVATLETPILAGMQLRLLTVENVFEMVEAGILGGDERVELVEGVLVQMSPEGRPDVVTIRELNGRLGHHYPWPQYHVQVQSTQPLTDHRLRIPDLIVARRVLGEWLVPADVVLFIEVAETSHAQDTGAKAREYARWGVPVYWVVDLKERQVLVFENPHDGVYAGPAVMGEDQELALPGTATSVPVKEILPPRN